MEEMFLRIKAWETTGELFYRDKIYKITLDKPITIDNKGCNFYFPPNLEEWSKNYINEVLKGN